MDIRIRPAAPDDAEACGRIIYEAFKGIAERHDFRPDFPSADAGAQLAHLFINDPKVYGVVAEAGGRVVGSNFLSEWDPVRGVGPITVDPDTQARGTGRRLMEAVIERGRGAAGVRLVQDSFNAASLSLYASLGFEVKEPLALMEGSPVGEPPAGYEVRPMREGDHTAAAELCGRVHGFSRAGELKGLAPALGPFVVLREGRVTAYASAPNSWPLGHAVAEGEDDMRALLAGAARESGEPLSFLLPTRQAGLFRWCLGEGMRVVKTMTLMATGEYRGPRGAYLTSVLY
ncbi:MAG: GNAT family N-acetyltransferase [Acidobacteria bacterium]|nr:GNAT family N-acetyltransferase [Acidobacteriota bacterium]MCA1619842.1 GNAT family N-acetyltransferase [Acidobacteriota bacterium]